MAIKTEQKHKKHARDKSTLSTREQILEAATHLFAERGYLGTGMRDLEDMVGIRRGALYYHIGNKENLLYEIVTASIENTTAKAQGIVESDQSAELKLREIGRMLLHDIAENLESVTVFYRDWTWLTGERRDAVLAARDKFEAAIDDVIQQGIRESGWIDRGKLMRLGILGMLNQSYLWFKSGGKLKPESVADIFVDMLLEGLLPRRGKK